MRNRWTILVLVFLTTAIGMMAFASVFPLLSLWIKDLGITRAEGGLLSGFWYLPGIVISLPAGWLFDRYQVRRVLLLCWVLIVAGMGLMAVAPSFWVLCAGRLLFSIGMNANMIGAPKLLGQTFAGRRELGFVMGVYTMAFTLGIFLALNVLGTIGANQGWRPAMQLMAGLSAAGLAMLFLIPKSAEGIETGGTGVKFNPFGLGIGAWVLAIAYFGYSIGTEGFLTFGPDALVGRGIDLARASAIVGSYAIIALVLKPFLSSQLKASNGIAYVLAATFAALLATGLFVVPGMMPQVGVSMLGVSLAIGMPAWMALPSFLFPPDRSGQCYGLYQTLYSLGFIAQPLVGFAADKMGGYTAGFAVIAAYCALGGLVALPVVRRLRA
jgi:MFS family permease